MSSTDELSKPAQLSPAKQALLERMRKRAALAVAPVIRRREKRERAPLSFAQQRLWLIQQLDPASCLYNVPRALHLHGKLNVAALEKALNSVIARHEVLRTTFPADENGQPWQQIHPQLGIVLGVTTVDSNGKDRHARMHDLALEFGQKPFDLANGPVFRAHLFRFEEDEHLLAIAMHHIISDGWTGGLLFRELGEFYHAHLHGSTDSASELAVQYADYAIWQREWMQGAVLENELKFWRKHLEGAPPSLEIPTDLERPEQLNYHGGSRSLALSPEATTRLRALCQQESTTLFPAMLAALDILLYRWSGQADVVVGTVSANRDQTEIENLIGCFMNFLPLRARVAPGESALEFLRRAKREVFESFAHQSCPFEKIIEAVRPQRSMNVNPLYNVGLLVQNYPEIAFRTDSLEAKLLRIEESVAFLDLRFIAEETPTGISIDCEYNQDLFTGETATRLLEGYVSVLEQVIAAPEMRIADVTVPPALAEQAAAAQKREQKQLFAIASTFTAEPVEAPLAFWMKELGVRAEFGFAPYNQVFQQLLDPASLISRNTDGVNIILLRLTDWLRFEQGASEAEAKGKVQNNSDELVAALAGRAQRSTAPTVLCICPPEKRFASDPAWNGFLQETEQSLLSRVASIAGVHGIGESQTLEFYPVAEYEDEYADKLGHIPYTPAFFTALGSMLARRIAALRTAPRKVIVLDCDNTLWSGVCGEEGATGVCVDSPRRTLQEFMLRQIQAGMLLALCSKNAEEDVDAVFAHNSGMVLKAEHIAARRVNWNAKSQNLRELAQELQLGLDSFVFIDDNPIECAEVQAQYPEVLTLALPQEAEQIPDFLRSVWPLDHWKVTEEDARRTEMYRQGAEREQLRKQASTLDEFLAGLELNIEIRPMQDAELPRVSQLTERTNQFNFTTIRRSEAEVRQFLDQGGECLIVNLSDRFGDYGLVGVMFYAPVDSSLAIDTMLLSCRALGRKVEHHMLSRLGEIAQKRNLARVAAKFRPTKKNQPALDFLNSMGSDFHRSVDGYSLYDFPAEFAAQAHRIQVAAAAEVSEESSPKSVQKATGGANIVRQSRTLERIARDLRDVSGIARAMEVARVARKQQRGAYVAPRSPIEEMVAGAWSQLLNVDRVGVHDNFFALGGHSLLATQVVARVRQTLGVELPLRAVFEAPTVAEFALRIQNEQRLGAEFKAPPIKKLARRNQIPLSFAQQRMWLLDQLEPGNPVYNVPQMARMRGKLDVDALKRSLNRIVERHESLRTTFSVAGGQPVQVIAPRVEIPLRIADLSELPADQRETEARKLALEDAQQSFDLSRGPLVRAKLYRLDDEDHILLLTMHHIISDRWSMGLVSEELAAHYAAFVQGAPSPLPDLAIQYCDFAVWQREWLQGEVLQKQLDYWKDHLAGAPPVLELPTDHPRPPVLSVRGGTQAILLNRDLVEKLTALSQSEGATLFMTLLAAFQTLLARYSGQEDIVVGSPIANRNFAEIEPLVGFFVNTLALRGDLSGDPTLRELIARNKESCLHAYAHQDIPFERLVEELQPERSLSHSPIFQVLFALQNAPLQALELPGLKLERLPVYTGLSMFDMSWFVIEVADGLIVRVEYAKDLFEDPTITRTLGHFQTLLQACVAHPERCVSQLSILGEAERRIVVEEFNATAVDFPRLCIHNLLERSAGRVPDATALICGEDRTSYRELNRRANQIAHHLIRLGAGPDVLIGVFMERTPDLVPAIFGVLKSGSAYVPLDPSYPRERLQSILEDSKAPIVLTQKSLAGQLEGKNVRFVCVDEERQTIARESSENPRTAVTPDNLAYVLFTSGSTGRPKGVALEHHNNVTFVQWAQTVFTPQELAGVLFCTSIGFDMSTFEMFITAAAGGKIILAENPLYLPALPAKDEVTLINTVPSAIAELVRMNALPESLGTVALAGEALPESLVEEIYRSGAVRSVYNLYGPTESGYSTWTLVPRGGRVTIGKPIANEQGYILDKERNPLPIGVPGELYLAGEGLARGYFGRPDLTAERFVHNPFSAQKNARMYKTGDLCRWLADGNIEYLGRIDHQVKLRGFRIELGEIEAVLTKHPAVRQCLLLAREDQPGFKRLVAYVVPQEGTTPNPDDLAKHLKQSLPDYMIPSAFVVLEAFPLTPNGKIDRKALPTPEYRKDAGENYIAPRTPVEEKIAAIWAEVLHLEKVSADGDFFALGGHSLLAAQVISRLRQAFEVEIPLKAMFESPVLEVLAARIQTAKHGFEVPQITRVQRGKPLPTSFAQQRVWFLDQLEPNNSVFNIAYTLKITGSVDADALEKSLNLIAARHESLRTSFSTQGDDCVQVIHESIRIPFRRIDLTTLDAGVRESEVRRQIADDANTPFDLTKAPLARAIFLRLGDDEHYLLINIHHIISDRWSMGVLTQELASAYEATVAGRVPELPDLPLQYADYSVWQRNWLRGEVLDKQLAYWKDKLQAAPPVLEMPTDRPRQATESFRGDVAYITLPGKLRDKLNHASRTHGTTLFMTLLAGFQALLSRYSGQDDIVVGTAIANRTHPDLEKVIGFFLNTQPLRTRVDGDPTFSEILARAKETALGAYAHQDMPFEKLVEELKPERSLSYSPLVQVFFVLQNAPTESLQLQGLQLKAVPSGIKTVKGDMYLSMHETADGLEGRLEYSTDLFDTATMERLLGHFEVLLDAAASNPELKLSELPLLTESERQTILVDWNATYFNYPRDLCLHQLFEQQVEKTPDAVACIFPGSSADKGRQFTYRELNDRANQLAHYLRRHGAVAGKPVGIFVERSLEMMVGLLGIQKSGSTYIPLDPGYPPDRVKAAVEDARIPILVTQHELLASLPESEAKIICLDRDGPQISQESVVNPTNTSDPNDLLYVIFTSGSTGRPKGVQVPQRAVVNLLTFMAQALQAGPNDVFPALAPFAFDMCIPELYLALVTGGRVVVVPREVSGDGEALAALLRRTRATIIHATPTTWRLLLDAGFDGRGLKRAIGAEPVPPELCKRLVEADPSLYNFYGPTETTVWSTYHHFVSSQEPVVVGKPLANTQVYILDKNQQPLPVGIAGEIYIGGDGVSEGYLNRPDLTAEKFVANPFADEHMLDTADVEGLLPYEIFEMQSTRIPNRVAAVFGNQTITYKELNARSNQLARHLRGLGVGPDVLVGLYLDRSLDMLVALLGVLKSGGAYVPLDPAYPKERIAFIVEDASPAVLLTQDSLLASLPKSAAKVVRIDSDWETIAVENPGSLASTSFPNHLAYVLYTSGSTGKPKGVEIERGNLLNFLLSMQKTPGLRGVDRLLAVTTLSFDIAGLEIYLPLVTGATVMMASRDQAADAQQLLALMENAAPTVMQATPATWRMLINAGWKGSPKLKALCGGEALPGDLAKELLPRCAELWNMYGPTETTIWSSVYRVNSELEAAAPIGRPIDRTSMYVLSDQMQPLPVGVAGELYIGGDGLARGYRNRPSLTSEKFVADPFSRRANARLYRTGDLAKYLPDGNIQYIGRTDFQVKVRGFRIELGEIESALVKHPAVRQAVVAAREDTPGDKRLVAYLVMQPGAHLPIAEVRTHLKQALPDYMIPSAVVELESLPLTPNGKVDRKHLPAPDQSAGTASGQGRQPSTATEEIIAGIFAEVLKVQAPSADDDFFELGGHSLLATQVISRVRQAFQTELPLRALFEASTIAALAQRVETAKRQERGLEAPPMRHAPRDQALPVSFSQQRLWFLDQLEPGNPLYNVSYVTRMRGPLNPDALERSINEIVRRHESLRTTFRTLNDQPVQVIAPTLELKLVRMDTSHLPTLEERENEARRLASEEIRRPFDLVVGPLLRGLLIRIGEDDNALILVTHHIISDRWSLSVFSQEMAALYEANLAGHPSPLTELQYQYADYAVWQREYLSGEVLAKQLGYWRHELEGAPPVLELPTDRPRTATEQFWGVRHLQPIPAELSAALKGLSRKQRGTFFMTLLSGFQLLLSQLSGQNDVLVGTDLANRNQLEAERMIGFFVNLLPVRARIDQDAAFSDFFQQIRSTSLEAMAHQDIPFDKLVEELRPERSLTHNPLVQVLFVMQNTPQAATEFGGLKLGALGVSSSSRFDLVLFINNPETDPSTMWVYNPKLFDAGTIARMANAYELLLKTIAEDPGVKISSLFATLQKAEEAHRGSEQKKFQEAGLEKLRKIRRKAIEV